MADEVFCYSGYTYAQEPRAFIWRGERYTVATLERTWWSPEGRHFLVCTEAGERFELLYREHLADWLISRCGK